MIIGIQVLGLPEPPFNSFQFPDFNLEKLPGGSVLKLEQDISCSGVTPPPNNTVYVRESSRKLWCDLVGCKYTPTEINPTNQPEDFSNMSTQEWKVYGSPGIGKSLEVFLAACHFACRERILYVRYGSKNVKVLLGYPVTSQSSHVTSESSTVIEETSPVQLCQFDVILDDSVTTIDWKSCLRHYKPKRVIADGYDGEILEVIAQECHWYSKESNQNIPRIICASMPSTKLRQEAFGERRMTVHQMDSWTLKEYLDAAEKGVIPLTPYEVIAKYYYVGGSFRLITWELKDIMRFLRTKLSEVSNIEDLSKFIVGEHSRVAVNSLRNMYNSQFSILSRFIISELSRTRYNSVDTTLPYLRKTMQDNSVLRDWVTKYHCLSLMRQASNLSKTYSMKYLTFDKKKIEPLCMSIPTVRTLLYDGLLEHVDISEGAVMIDFEKYDYNDIDAIVINHVIDPVADETAPVTPVATTKVAKSKSKSKSKSKKNRLLESVDDETATDPAPIATTKAGKNLIGGKNVGEKKVVYFLQITDNPEHKFNVERLHDKAVTLGADILHFLIVIRHNKILEFQKECTIPQRVTAEWKAKYGQEQTAKRQKTDTGSQAAKSISFSSAIVLYDSSEQP